MQLVTTPVVIAHPASVVLGLLLVRLHKRHKIRRANATILEPASERGRGGMDDSHEQTVNLAFVSAIAHDGFRNAGGVRMSCRAFGEGAEPTMASIEDRMLRHYRAITNKRAPVPSLMLVAFSGLPRSTLFPYTLTSSRRPRWLNSRRRLPVSTSSLWTERRASPVI